MNQTIVKFLIVILLSLTAQVISKINEGRVEITLSKINKHGKNKSVNKLERR